MFSIAVIYIQLLLRRCHILIYSDCEFICLAQKRIKIFNVEKKSFLNISKWQEVKFKINELTDEEVTEYKSQQ
jgi:hypothetical protein